MNTKQKANANEATTPKPSYAPAGMAMGIIMLMWGILTHWIMSAVGAGMIAWSLITWMKQIREG